MIKLRQMRGRLNGLSKVILSSALLLFITVACEDDEGLNTVDDVLYIDGPAAVSPASTQTYTAGEFGGDVTWSVEGNATLGATSGLTAEVSFTSVGTATITVQGNGLTGTREITVSSVDLEMGVEFDISSTINEDGVDNITLSFSAPLASVPALVLNGTVAGDTSVINIVDNMGQAPYTKGSLTGLTEVAGSNMMKFIATYTATGASENTGQLEGYVNNVAVSADYGGASADRMYFLLHTVDNVAPFGELSVSASDAKEGAEVTFTVTLNEGARAAGGDMVVDYTYDAGSAGTDGQVVMTASDDAAVWTGSLTVDGTGDGMLTAVLDATTVVDLAGNAPTQLGVNGVVNIDNTKPVPVLTAIEAPASSKLVNINTSSDDVMWIWLADNSPLAVNGAADFEGKGKGSDQFVAEPGTYKVYYMEIDAAGNASDVELLEGVVVAE